MQKTKGNKMLCEKCKQRRAIVHLTRIVSDKSYKQDICAVCFERLEPELAAEQKKMLKTGQISCGWTSYPLKSN
jgi:protein-arginine kinase activator protein McsA